MAEGLLGGMLGGEEKEKIAPARPFPPARVGASPSARSTAHDSSHDRSERRDVWIRVMDRNFLAALRLAAAVA
ncbi:MAG: hypothetical protein ACLQFT_10115 [Steroidobacteraceae bacterium]|jgi:hypothetical protein